MSDTERQARLMEILDIWTSRTPGTWIEDGSCLVDTGEPFAEDRQVEYGCSRDEPEGGDHPFSVGRDCVFLDADNPVPAKAKTRVQTLQKRLQRDLGRSLAVGERERITSRGCPFDVVQLLLPDFEHILVQARYLDGATTIANVQAWRGIPIRPKGWRRESAPAWADLTKPWPIVVVGLDAEDREAAYIMPLAVDGARSSIVAPAARAALSGAGR